MSNIIDKTKERLEEYEKRHQTILNSAMRLFNAKGYAATTTASIAKEAGVTEKTMYRHFENKEVLFGACVLSITQDMATLRNNALEENRDDELGYLKAQTSSYVDFVMNNPDKSMFLVHLYSYRVIPELDKGFRRTMNQQLNEVEKVIESMQKKGVVKNDSHPRLLAGLFVGGYFTTVFLHEFLDQKIYNPKTAMEIIEHLLGID